MARYIDADKIVFWIKYVSSNGMLCDTDVRKVAFSDEIARIPTADVVPRAEMAREIFEEMDRELFHHIPDLYTLEIYTKLKKKYTGDAP